MVLFALAVLALQSGRVVEVGLQIASVAYGALLGVFLLGVLTRKANQRGAMVGMLFGFCVGLYLWQWNACAVDVVGVDWDDGDVRRGITPRACFSAE
jgi:SSS family solute:Na+ symporter